MEKRPYTVLVRINGTEMTMQTSTECVFCLIPSLIEQAKENHVLTAENSALDMSISGVYAGYCEDLLPQIMNKLEEFSKLPDDQVLHGHLDTYMKSMVHN